MTPEQAKTLGKIEQKIDDLVDANKERHKEIKTEIKNNHSSVEKKLGDKDILSAARQIECQKMFDSRPKLPLMLWLFAGVFASLLMIGGLVFDLRNSVETHIDKGEQFILEYTGKPASLR